MTEKEAIEKEEAWQQELQQQRDAARAALESRGGQPPRRSQVGGPPADWRNFNALLDGKPVGSCWAYDADAGWVEVWVIVKKNENGSVTRAANEDRRRVYGTVTPVALEEWERMKKAQGETLEVWQSAPFGEVVPGTALRRR